MSTSQPVGNISAALNARLHPTVTTWNRLEGRPRTLSFDRALRAEVRDALWLLTRQWQLGEFRGSDAGSPVFAKLRLDTTRLTKYRPDTHDTVALSYDVPLELTVEQRPVPLSAHGRKLSLDLRLALGRQWLTLTAALPGYRQAFIDAYPIAKPDPTDRADADVCAHPEVWQVVAAVAGRMMDGLALHAYLTADPGHHAYDGVAGISAGDYATIDAAATRFLGAVNRVLRQPGPDDDAWVPDRLEYQFAASAPMPAAGTEKVYIADSYGQGELDWYSVDVDAATPALPPVPGADVTGLPPDAARTMIPVPVSFAGMPNTRWWSFEDSQTNYGDVDASTTDLAKLLFLEFALVYANDWFLIPWTLPTGTVAAVRALVVTNTFGERLWVGAAGSGPDDAWQRWSMFTVNVRGKDGAPADTAMVLLPTVPKIQEGQPIEDVWLIRDEVANMVWGVERVVPLASGDTKPGGEAAAQTLAFYRAELAARLGGPPPPPPLAAADIRYEVMSTVPENWIPFLPVHLEGDNREIQLQRAALPRILDGDPDPAVKVEPRTGLLRQGLDEATAQPYFLHEEEVPRAGTRLLRAYQRTRWLDGQVYTWLRVRRQTGRGEGSSGLAFDVLAHTGE